MSNEKRSFNTSRRIRKGCKERLNHLMLKRSLSKITKVISDENLNKKSILELDQENISRFIN